MAQPEVYTGTGIEADCITDNLTGLMWPKNGNLPGNWNVAIDYANNLTLCGYSDWRLPNVNELESLVNAGVSDTAAWLNTQGFYNVENNFYWSSTTNAYVAENAWVVGVWAGYVIYDISTYYTDEYRVWPVRSGQQDNFDPAYPANVWKTGQQTSYIAGDDGDFERGVSWPEPRFIENGDCITDNLTGLIRTDVDKKRKSCRVHVVAAGN